ncbi:MAG: HAD family hydrolase [Planctomycetales bacterium]|nr:HAD family hydrolase [Planctomycetales bacterium]
MKALALDFDGVISNSAVESFLIALQTQVDLQPNSPLAALVKSLFTDQPIPEADCVAATSAYQAFIDLMPLGNGAEDYGVAMAMVERGITTDDQQSYNALRSEYDLDYLLEFHNRFYATRHALAAAYPREWRRLMRPYPGITASLREWSQGVRLALATAKDRPSVDALLEDYGIADLFPSSLILDNEAGSNKTAHLNAIADRLSIELHEATFIDDKVNHLDSVAPLGVRCVLAGWGYNTPREHALAEERGYLVCSLDDCQRQLFDAC